MADAPPGTPVCRTCARPPRLYRPLEDPPCGLECRGSAPELLHPPAGVVGRDAKPNQVIEAVSLSRSKTRDIRLGRRMLSPDHQSCHRIGRHDDSLAQSIVLGIPFPCTRRARRIVAK